MNSEAYGVNELTPIRTDCVVLRRPHFRLVGSDLFFLISRRPLVRLSKAEAQVWSSLREDTTVEELQSRFAAQADPIIRRLIDLGVCDLAVSHVSSGRRRVLVIEPHSDDAVLSVGGTMWLRRATCEFTIATIGSRSNFTSYYAAPDRGFFEVDRITSLRGAEGALVARLLGGRCISLGRSEVTLRYRDGDWSPDWFRRHRVSVSVSTIRSYGDAELRDWTVAVRRLLREVQTEEVWMPIGVGTHCDHQLTRDACISAVQQEPALIKGRTVRLYQEVPYAAQKPAYTASLVNALVRAGAMLVSETVCVDDVFDQKLRLVSIYASQFKLGVLQPGIEASARLAAGPTGRAELLWRVERFPTVFDPFSCCIHEPIVRKIGRRVCRWSERHRNTDRVRVLLLLPAGRWAKDAKDLLLSFPKATFDVYVSPSAAAEVLAFDSPRIHVHCVGAGMKAWTMLALTLMLARPTPTLFIAGEKRRKLAHGLAGLWPMSHPLVLASIDHFLLALHHRDHSS